MRIGLIDHHLENFHANTFVDLLKDGQVGHDVEVVAAYEKAPLPGDWCAEHQIRRASSPAEVVAASDAILLLAPDNVDSHPKLSREALESGKPLVVDKFLAPSPAEAEQMVAIARKAGTPLFSSTAVRFAAELDALSVGGRAVSGRGFGAWPGYAIHTIQPVLKLLGAPVARVIDTGGAPYARTVTIETVEGVRGLVDVRPNVPHDVALWQFGVQRGDGASEVEVRDLAGFYAGFLRAAVEFARTGISPVPDEEMLDVVRVLDYAERSRQAGRQWYDGTEAAR
ncbi:Gfo/Idh/MocA family protein [Kribbella sp. GL6]|uniref:Gfo/Idh/MocA family protein n=1 Tax=Kribbella sp. GL6 TaxID=3419765 RepID=UPI003D02DEEA